jgi:hypothetical protein
MPTTPSRPPGPWTRAFAAAVFVSFLTGLGCDSTTPTPQGAGGGGSGGAPSGAAGGGGPVTGTGAGGLRAGLQANGSIAYVRNK